MTPAKAAREFTWMLEETTASERIAIRDQKLMGDACRELRLAHDIPRNAMASQLGLDSLAVSEIERRCTSDQAKAYRRAVKALRRHYRAPRAQKGIK